MARQTYQRVDLSRLAEGPGTGAADAADAAAPAPDTTFAGAAQPHTATAVAPAPLPTAASTATAAPAPPGVRWAVVPLSAALCTAQAALTVLAENLHSVYLTATLIAIGAYGALFTLMLLVNPVVRWVCRGRFLRPLTRAELMCIFTAMLVTAGISTFGLTSQLVPFVASPWNPDWNTPQRGWDVAVLPRLNPQLYLTVPQSGDAAADAVALEQVRTFREGATHKRSGEPLVRPHPSAPWTQWAGFYAVVVTQVVPWSIWLPPLAFWMIFVAACYGLFYSLTYLVLPGWSKREKLIFPLAKLPESLLPEEGRPHGSLPATVKRLAFWGGFLLSAALLTWNCLVGAGFIAGIGPFPLGMGPASADQVFQFTALHGLTPGGISFMVIFTAVGIAFLVPTEISFSAWIYHVARMLMILIAVWLGFGQDIRDFPGDWMLVNNFVSAQGAGAILLFGAVHFWRSSRQCVGDARRGQGAERWRAAMPLIGTGLCLIVLGVWLRWNSLPVLGSALLLAFIVLMTLGLMRAVAQCGIYWFQSYASFFHFYGVFGLGRLIAPPLLGPLIPIYTTLFVDLKTFIAPNILNAAKMQEDAGASPRRFHVNLVTCLAVTIAASIGLSITLAYVRGGNTMNFWFYTESPQRAFDLATRATTMVPQFDSVRASWYSVGAAWTALSLFLRQRFFWFPHPIGYILLISPLMNSLWFSFFLGWIFKKVVTRYGGKATYDKVLPFFIGLIVGELLTIFVWALLGLWYGFPVRIDLNRLA